MKPLFVLICLLSFNSLSNAQTNTLSTQTLAEMLRSASSFHDLVQNLNKSLGPDVHAVGPNGTLQHSAERTAVTIGAGAGVGAAIGEMTKSPNGVLVGALLGGAGGLVVDQILKHREQTRVPVAVGPVPDNSSPGQQQLLRRP